MWTSNSCCFVLFQFQIYIFKFKNMKQECLLTLFPFSLRFSLSAIRFRNLGLKASSFHEYILLVNEKLSATGINFKVCSSLVFLISKS